MSTTAFDTVAETSRVLHYRLEFAEDINQRMRIPDTLRVNDAENTKDPLALLPSPQWALAHHQHRKPATFMHVPERITIAGEDADGWDLPYCHHPGDYLHPIHTSPPPLDSDRMTPPPHVLTLREQPLECLEAQQRTTPSPSPTHRARQETTLSHCSHNVRQEGPHCPSSSRGEDQSATSENVAASQNGRRVIIDIAEASETSLSPSLPSSPLPSSSAPPFIVCPPLCCPEDADTNLYTARGLLTYMQSTTGRGYRQALELLNKSRAHQQQQEEVLVLDELDTSSLRRQMETMKRRLQLLEEESHERSRQAVVLSAATVAFWLVKACVWLRQ